MRIHMNTHIYTDTRTLTEAYTPNQNHTLSCMSGVHMRMSCCKSRGIGCASVHAHRCVCAHRYTLLPRVAPPNWQLLCVALWTPHVMS